MDKKLTKEIKSWLDSLEKDYSLGALLLLRLTGNQIVYANNMRKIASNVIQQSISLQLQKHYDFRVQNLTHEEVQVMTVEAEKIISEHCLEQTEKDWKPGKRDDHNELPDEIQALYVENLDILHRMRELHLELRHLSGLGKSKEFCQDSDRYPFLKELIALDKKYHANWKLYDRFVIGNDEA